MSVISKYNNFKHEYEYIRIFDFCFPLYRSDIKIATLITNQNPYIYSILGSLSHIKRILSLEYNESNQRIIIVIEEKEPS